MHIYCERRKLQVTTSCKKLCLVLVFAVVAALISAPLILHDTMSPCHSVVVTLALENSLAIFFFLAWNIVKAANPWRQKLRKIFSLTGTKACTKKKKSLRIPRGKGSLSSLAPCQLLQAITGWSPVWNNVIGSSLFQHLQMSSATSLWSSQN